jgi:hypothetical protein
MSILLLRASDAFSLVNHQSMQGSTLRALEVNGMCDLSVRAASFSPFGSFAWRI